MMTAAENILPFNMIQTKEPRMRWSFGVKLGLILSVIAVLFTSCSVFYFYSNTRDIIFKQMSARLLDVGRTGAYLFDAPTRAELNAFIQLLENNALPTTETMLNLPDGETMQSLSLENIKKYAASPIFIKLVQKLREIKSATRTAVVPLHHLEQELPEYKIDAPLISSAYIMVKIPQVPQGRILRTIADSDYEDIPNEEGNHVGNLYAESSDYPALSQVYDGQAHVADAFISDQWGTYLTAAVPIKAADGTVITSLGIDLDVTNEANQVQQLWYTSLAIVGASLVLSFIAAALLARWLQVPVRKLHHAAEAVQRGNLDTRVTIRTQDELEVFSHTFNNMVATLQEYSRNLEHKVAERTTELELANQQIIMLNEQLREENLRMGAELDITRRLQQMMLPKEYELSQIKGLDIAGFMEPATEVGGDYYDVLQHNGQIKIGIGDVTGHGLESGVMMLMVQMAVRTLLANNVTDPDICLKVLNQALYDNVKRMNSDKNLTLSLMDYENGKLRFAGQHEEVLVVRANGEVERIDTLNLGFMVGMQSNIDPFIKRSEVHLQVGDGVVLYTDGITEAWNAYNEMYGIERLCDVISNNWHLSAKTIEKAVIQDVRQFIQDQPLEDDVTLLVMKQVDVLE